MSDSLVTPWTTACQAPLSVGFSRQEYWSGLSFPSPGDLPDPGIKPTSPALAGRFFTTEPPRKPKIYLGAPRSLQGISLLNLKRVSAGCCVSENFFPFSTPGPSPHVIHKHPGWLPALPVTLKGAATLTKSAAPRAPKSNRTAASRAEQ